MHKVDYINKIIELKPEYKKNIWRLWNYSIKNLKNTFIKIQKEESNEKNNN